MIDAAVRQLCMASGTAPRHFIRQWRKHSGYTLEQLAERIGMSHQNLGKIERGLVPYSETLLELLAEIFKTDPASIIIRDPTHPEPIWSIWDNVPQAQRPGMIAAIKALTKTGTDG